MKRLICLAFALILVYTVFSLNVFATQEIASGHCGDGLTWVLTNDGVLTISGIGSMYDADSATDSPWFENESITKVVIENGVTSIGDCAFYRCSNLSEIIIPDSVTKIGEYAFFSCTSLTEIDIPDYVTDIGLAAFKYCSALQSIILSNSLERIRHDVFDSCTSLSSIRIPNSVTTIGIVSFFNCTSLTDIVIPESVNYLGELAFDCCSNLSKITFLNPNTEIFDSEETVNSNVVIFGYQNSTAQAYAEKYNRIFFELCDGNHIYGTWQNLDGEKHIRYCELEGCDESETEFHIFTHKFDDVCDNCNYVRIIENSIARGICGDNAYWSLSADGTLTVSGTGDMYDYVWYLPAPWADYNGNIKTVIIEDGITSVGNSAFSNCASLITIIIPSSISKIGEFAFADCSSLQDLELDEGLKSIGQFAFRSCTGLTDLSLPASLETIGNSAFFGCSNLERIIFFNATTSIYDNNSTIPDNALICGYENSTAQTYAENVGRWFVPFCEGNHTYSGWQVYTETHHIRKCLGIMLDSGICGTATGYLSVSDRLVSWPDVSVGAEYVIIYNNDTENKFTTNETSVTVPDDVTNVAVFYADMPLGEVIFSAYGELGADCYGYELANHLWDNGIITTVPTCSSDGIITYTCTDCGAEKLDVADATGAHSFGDWQRFNDESHIRYCLGIAESTIATGELCSEVVFSIPIDNDVSFGDKLVLRLPTIGKYCVSINDSLYPLGTTDTTIYGEYTITFGDRAYGYNSKNGDTLVPLSAIDSMSTITVIGRYPIKTNGSGKVTYRVSSADFGYYTEPSENGYANSKFTTTFWPTTQHYDVYALLNGNAATISYCWDWNVTDKSEVIDNTDIISYCRAYEMERHDWNKDNGEISGDKITYTCKECDAKLTEDYVTYVVGDLNGNDTVDKNDAIYLLYSVLFGDETYPLNQPCDYNSDGITDKNDAIYLLYHALFGAESYPLN